MINMKSILFVIGLLLSNFVFSQSNKQLHDIKPNWKLGDTKKVRMESFTKIYVNDSLFNNTEATSYYGIKVVDTIKNYTLLYSNVPNSLDIKSSSSIPEADSVGDFLASMIKKIETETKYFEYEILVDKNTGQALRIKNEENFLSLIEKVVSKMMVEYGEKVGKTKAQIDSMNQKIVGYYKLMEPKILETTINEFNYIMWAYSLRFPYNSSISQEVMVHDINGMGKFGDIEMPAVLTTSSKKDDNGLTVHTDTDYDKDFLLEQIKKNYKNMKNLGTSDIFLSEITESLFTNMTNWIVSHKSTVVFRTKEVEVVNETNVFFQ